MQTSVHPDLRFGVRLIAEELNIGISSEKKTHKFLTKKSIIKLDWTAH
jgi:hypothetical protein